MSKLKTKKSAAKRFKLTGTGKVRFRRAERAHGNTKKTTKIMRHRRANGVLSASDEVIAKSMIPAFQGA